MSLFNKTEQFTQQWEQMPTMSLIRNFSAGLTLADKQAIALAMENIMANYYVHYYQKKIALAIDPVDEAKLLYSYAATFNTDMDFFVAVMEIFTKLRDRHTAFTVPPPLNQVVAILPFMAESFVGSDLQTRLMVTKVAVNNLDKDFKPGVEILYWNGRSVPAYLKVQGLKTPGANPWAMQALTIRLLTSRPLAYILPPDDDWVTITYRTVKGEVKNVTIPWKAYFPGQFNQPMTLLSNIKGTPSTILGMDDSVRLANQTLYAIHSADQFLTKPDKPKTTNSLANNSNISFTTVKSGTKTFGYIRLFSFDFQDSTQFIKDFAEILESLPQNGLIINVKGNPGGIIPCGEGAAQLFSEKPIETALCTMIATKPVQQMANGIPFLAQWRKSLNILLQTGQLYSQAYSLTDLKPALDINYKYKGKVVVITDALCYSTTDFFAAAMQSNGLATILGTDPVTGAGGANLWSITNLIEYLNYAGIYTLQPLPKGVDISIAMRKAMKRGADEGLPLEDIGVWADVIHNTTLNDLLFNNVDLIKHACQILEGKTPSSGLFSAKTPLI